MSIKQEIKINHDKFFKDWTKQAPDNWKALSGNAIFEESYRRLCVVSAFRSYLIEPTTSKSVQAFSLEASNDAITCHVLASIGAWRSSLQSLRSYIENILCCLFYKDHPVELLLWERGRNRLSFVELHSYFVAHPYLIGIPLSASGLEQLKNEYSELSKAVHGSAQSFRMTDDAGKILLWDTSAVKAAAWSTRERKVHESVCLLVAYLFKEQLQGTRLPQVRDLLELVISKTKAANLKKYGSIKI